jgi:hypothetical protein
LLSFTDFAALTAVLMPLFLQEAAVTTDPTICFVYQKNLSLSETIVSFKARLSIVFENSARIVVV